jgi:hypothetical protein
MMRWLQFPYSMVFRHSRIAGALTEAATFGISICELDVRYWQLANIPAVA